MPGLYGFALLTCSMHFQPFSDARSGLASEVSRLVQLLELSLESTVADLGARSGEVSIESARQLGAKARVYSTDINTIRLEEIKKATTASWVTKAKFTDVFSCEQPREST